MRLKKIVLELSNLQSNLIAVSHDNDDVKLTQKIIDELNEIIIDAEHAKTMSGEIDLRRLMNEKFAASTSAIAYAGNSTPSSIRTMINQGRKVLPLLNGDYILVNKETRIFKVKWYDPILRIFKVK